jgi:WD40 repeat protein
VCCVAFAPDGKRAASGGEDRTVRLWQLPGGRPLRSLDGHRSAILHVAFSADGRRVFSAGDFLDAWNAATGKLLRRRGGDLRAWCAAFAADGSLALTGGTEKALRLWRGE